MATASPSKRQLQVARIIQEAMHSVLAQENLLSSQGLLCSVQTISVTPNLREARIFLSIYPSDKVAECWQYLSKIEPQMRKSLQQKLQNQFSRMPKFSFHLDKSAEQADRIYQILDKLELEN